MSALIAVIVALAQALMPLVSKLILGKISEADAKAAADHAVADYLHSSANLLASESADDSAADSAAASLPVAAPAK